MPVGSVVKELFCSMSAAQYRQLLGLNFTPAIHRVYFVTVLLV
jgi:hypothetical protein